MPAISTPPPKANKPAKGNRRDFVRTKISLGENLTSVALLLLIVLIGVAIAIKGQHFDPNIYTVRAGSLAGTAAAVTGKSQTPVHTSNTAGNPDKPAATSDTAAPQSDTAPADSGEGGDSANGNSSGAPAVKLPTTPMDIPLPGIKPMSDTEFYTADTLYEKIDGRSPAYAAFNVVGLRCRTFSVLAAAGSYVDVFEYRFDTPLDAFGMFSSERDPQGKSLDFAPDGYSGGMGYFFRQGPVYVQIIASDQKPETLAIATALAQNRAKELPVDDTGIAARRLLPTVDLVPDSIQFMLDNAQGQSYLANVFQAKYNFNGAPLSFFLTISPSADEAAKNWASFQKFCAGFGKVEVLPDDNGAKLFKAQIFGAWKIIYVRDKEVGGAVDAKDPDKAQAFVDQYLQGKLK